MRGKEKTPQKKRNKSKFLFFKKCINGEWRWLEKATWSQEYTYGRDGGSWSDIEWKD